MVRVTGKTPRGGRRVKDGRKWRSRIQKSNTASGIDRPLGGGIQDRKFLAVISKIRDMQLKDLHVVIEMARLRTEYQFAVIQDCLKVILRKINHTLSKDIREQLMPRKEQVLVLRRLIYGCGDTLLIAATGWGKSLIFHAYTVLTGKTTIQIIPLKKLGAEQLDDITKLGCTQPCLVTSDSKKVEKDLLTRIKSGEFNHILLGPEQAVTKEFKDILKDPVYQKRVGLVAIDEAHLIEQWKNFREKFTMLGQLRQILPKEVVWFGCKTNKLAVS
jgi:superfamily II DNA helicase RecQ